MAHGQGPLGDLQAPPGVAHGEELAMHQAGAQKAGHFAFLGVPGVVADQVVAGGDGKAQISCSELYRRHRAVGHLKS